MSVAKWIQGDLIAGLRHNNERLRRMIAFNTAFGDVLRTPQRAWRSAVGTSGRRVWRQGRGRSRCEPAAGRTRVRGWS